VYLTVPHHFARPSVRLVSARIFHFSPLIHIRRRPCHWPPLCPARMTHRQNNRNGVRWRVFVCIYALHHGRLAKRVVVARWGHPDRRRAVIDRLWSDWKRNRAPKTHTYIHSWLSVWMSEVHPYLPPSYQCCVVGTSSKTVFALYSCASERSSRTSRPNLDMGQRAAYSIGSRAET